MSDPSSQSTDNFAAAFQELQQELQQQTNALERLLSKEYKIVSHSTNQSNVSPQANQTTSANNTNRALSNFDSEPNLNTNTTTSPSSSRPKKQITFKSKNFQEMQNSSTYNEYEEILKGLRGHLEQEDSNVYQKLPHTALTGGDNRKRSNHILKRASTLSDPPPAAPEALYIQPGNTNTNFTPPLRRRQGNRVLSSFLLFSFSFSVI
jgi:hypothetical protein